MRARERLRRVPGRSSGRQVGETMDSNNHQAYASKLNIADFQIVDELSYLMWFLPMTYINDVVFPESKNVGSF